MKIKNRIKTKQVIIFMLLILSINNLLAQNRIGNISDNSSIESAKKYFRDNYQDLDPIEGIYDVALTQKAKNPLGRITSDDSSSPFFVFRIADGEYGTSINNHRIVRIGKTNVYSLVVQWGIGIRRYRFSFENNHFLISFEVPIDEIKRAMGTRYRPGFQTFISFDGIKTFPTEDNMVSQSGQPSTSVNENNSIITGTGFALRDEYIVTNYHVIANMKSITVYGVNGNSSIGYSARIYATDKTNDLAIIRISDSRFSGFWPIPYSINYSISDVGEDIWTLGYPLTQVLGNEIKLTNGVISSRSGYQGDVSTYQITAPVQPGSSGGPLFDSKGNIVGIVNAGVPGAENVGYAIKTSYLKNLADSYNISSSLPSYNRISSLALKEQVKKVRDFVFLLVCSTVDSDNSSSIVNISSTN